MPFACTEFIKESARIGIFHKKNTDSGIIILQKYLRRSRKLTYQHTVAKIFKIYAILNAVACFIFMYVLIAADYLDTLGVIIWLAASTVINFEIYAVGEVIQILDDIKQNTAKSACGSISEDTLSVTDELPEL